MNMIPQLENTLCRAILNSELEPSEDGEVAGFMTKGGEWYFVETDQPVISRPTIGHPNGRPTDRKMWLVMRAVTSGGSYWEPPDHDIVDVGELQQSLWDAIREAGRISYEDFLNGTCEGIAMEHHEKENRKYEEQLNNDASEIFGA